MNMKLLVFCLSSVVVSGSVAAKDTRFIVDKIIARVNGVNILQSSLEQPRIANEGGLYSLEEAITEELFVQKAIENHFLPTTLDVERQIVSFKMANDMADISDVELLLLNLKNN